MRRWNGWGDDSVTYPLPSSAAAMLEAKVGPAAPPRDATPSEALAAVPPPRPLSHPLVKNDAVERLRHARGQSFPDWLALRTARIAAFPDGVAYPFSEADVAELIRFAAEAGATLIPYGGGTSVVGHVNPLPDDDRPVLTVDLSRMNRLLRLDDASRLATFGAGVAGPDLEAQLRARGYTLGHFPQSFEYSTLGGWIATRSSGQESLGFGRIEDLFAGGRLLTPSGALELPPFPASAAGPDLRHLVLGSEGRLGILTEATVRVTPLADCEPLAVHALFFPDWKAAQAAVRQIAQARLPLSLVRLSTPAETETTLALAGHRRLIAALERMLALRKVGEGKCLLLLGCRGRSAVVKAACKEALHLAEKQEAVSVGRAFGKRWAKTRFRTPYLRNTLWEMGYGVDTLETAVVWKDVSSTVDAVEAALHAALVPFGERVHVFSHLSHVYPSGCSIYTTLIFRLAADPEETLARWQAMKTAASQAIVAAGGTISHQHGVGVDHMAYLQAEKGELGVALLRDAARRLDPAGIMNPGKLF